ncbi:erythrocyte membrane protein 1, PfEMP1, putative [Plasmodium sp. gorilla clade G1]|nr:erythrocyte membrane protein 1, PfEMP1, putative [Plasmodium sp. gorilla clade G1]
MASRKGVTIENKLSARDVLEKIATGIYNQEKEKMYPYEKELKGNLSYAIFVDQLRRELNIISTGESDSCRLDHLHHTNIRTGHKEGRNPCYDRNEERFSNEGEAKCGSDKIRDNENKKYGGACAPFRRQNLCDKNLEYLINENTNTTHDLLGNVLVTAKYEGASIVSNHPDKNSSGNKSGICTSLARSFADIGDIVRGRDMFKSNDNVEIGLKKVFEKIYNKFGQAERSYYSDTGNNVNYVKLREDWWMANRDQVWKAITCRAPQEANYFRNVSGNMKAFTSQGQCGHNDNSVPTNLDYVPQFLRWYDEWAEDFCRIRNHKLQKVKKECRNSGNPGHEYCSGDGEDCKKIVRQDYNIRSDFFCPSCKKECTNYKKWIDTKQGEFNKQKKKYVKEIKKGESNSDTTYDNKVYETLKSWYPLDTQFVATLKEAPYCNNDNADDTIDFNKPDDTFSRSKYCSSCPVFGVICIRGKCTEVDEDKCNEINVKVPKKITNKEDSTNISILVSDDRVNVIPNELDKICKDTGIFKGIRKDQRLCKYLCNLDVCDLTNDNNNKHIDKRISIRVLFKRWLEYFFKDYSKLKKKLNSCTNNGKESICINDCKKKCECVGKWAEEKRKEWEKVRKRYFNQYNVDNSEEFYTVESFVNGNVDHSDIKNALDEGEGLEALKKSDMCYNSGSAKKQECEKNDVVYILINRLKNKIDDCEKEHDEKTHEICCDELPGSAQDDEDEDEEGEKKKKVKDLEETKKKNEDDDNKFLDLCKNVKEYIEDNNNQTIIRKKCNTKEDGNWNDSTTKIDTQHIGAHMPPRRKSLCIRELRNLYEIGGKKSINDYKNAFVKCASIETYLLWQKYKTSNGAEDKLKGGEIPEDFKRIMYYTFGDYRDIFLGTDISSDGNIKNISNKIKDLMKENYSKATDGEGENLNSKLQSSWDEHKRDIWKGMLCGLTYDIKIENQKKNMRKILNNKYNYPCDLETFSKKPQFFRWFNEWSEDFCKNYRNAIEVLKKECNDADCMNKSINSREKNKKCKEACEHFKEWIKGWKNQYEQQRKKFNIDKNVAQKETAYINVNGLEPYEFFQNQYFVGPCECMKNKSESSANNDENIPEAFDEKPKEFKDKCPCTYDIPEPSETMSCIEKAAFKLRYASDDKIHSKISSKLKGNGSAFSCTNSASDNIFDETSCYKNEFNKTENINSVKASNMNRFDTNIIWDCDGKTKYDQIQLCVPPRRENMCIKGLEQLNETKHSDNKTLLKELQEIASTEGKSISKNFKQMDRENDDGICDAMKYSFADLADIVRGTDNYKNSNGNNNKVEENFKKIFEKIHNINSLKTEYSKDKPNFQRLRSDWWDTNRKEIWKALTCSAKDNNKIYKKGQKNTNNGKNKCGNKEDPPDDDYIPQPFRWLQEWSEHFCRVQNNNLNKLKKECGECNEKKNDLACMMNSNIKDMKCMNCKDACNDYTIMINTWNSQWKKQQEIYKVLYNTENKININKSKVIEFLDKTNDTCPYKPGSAENFLKESSHCIDLTFDKIKNSNTVPYAFEHPPDGYKVLCGTTYRKSCKKLKELGMNYTSENKIDLSGEKAKWEKLNDFVYVPPRTQQLCLQPLQTLISRTNKTEKVAEYDFSKTLQICAYNEARSLHNYYSKDGKDFVFSAGKSQDTKDEIKTNILENMKRSFADYGNLIKGTTQYEYNGLNKKLQDYIKTDLKYNGTDGKTSEDLWNKHKSDIWNSMLCGYNEENPSEPLHDKDIRCKLPHNDSEDEFLRWFQEWREDFCVIKGIHIQNMKDACKFNNCEDANNKSIRSCQKPCVKYKTWVEQRKIEYANQIQKYKNLNNNSNEGKESLLFLNDKCKGKCECIVQKESTDNIDKIFEEYPEKYKTQCECQPDPCSDLSVTDSGFPDASPFGGGQPRSACPTRRGNHNNCPTEEICKKYDSYINGCRPKTYHDNTNNWDSRGMLNSSSENEGVLIPPRRRHLCTRNIIKNLSRIKNKDHFKDYLMKSAYEEGKLLREKYRNNSRDGLNAMMFTFADYADIVKGTDIFGSILSQKLGEITGISNDINERKKWWNEIKNNIWEVMLCSYNGTKNNNNFYGNIVRENCNVPNTDEKDQFLRWLLEWGIQACKEKNIRRQALQTKCYCSNPNEISGSDIIKHHPCNNELTNYIQWNLMIKESLDQLNIKYQNMKASNIQENPSEINAEEYIETELKEGECNLVDIERIYNKIKQEHNPLKEILMYLCPNFEFPDDTFEYTGKTEPEDTTIKPEIPTPANPEDSIPSISPEDVHPTTSEDRNIFNSKILSSTIPFGIALALSSIVFLFLKKKTPSPVDLFRVINIPKGDYGMPTLKSSNRYIPYRSGQYKGKTYIYMEGDTDEDKYMFMSDTSDITSSESEYEEMDINDIYPYTSPKYKTLIEVVLEPSKRDTFNSQNGDTPKNKFTDEEWNQLKQDFISGILENTQKDLLKNNISGNTPMNSKHNTLYCDNPDEKPFITSIHDRNLYNGEEYSYNINVSTNSMDDPKYVSNNVYSGIDLINDTICGDHIDIYDELLKRKENELFGTNHTKNTSTNSVAKELCGDPIMNQINLLHKWLHRHRNMCEKWSNKEEMLDKLKEEFEKDYNSGDIPSDNHVLNTNVSIEIDMDNPKPKNEFANMDTYPYNSTMDYILDDMEDDIYYDVNDEKPSVDDIPMDHNREDVPKKVLVEMKILNNKSNGSLEQQFPISDVWNI